MQAVLVGEQASGKTTLYNLITLSENKTRYAGSSVTEKVFSK
jgi:ABC-type branched-subunit amino acid transport system ATPase component